MKLKTLTGSILIASASLLALSACSREHDSNAAKSTDTSTTVKPVSSKDQLSYSLGNIIGQRIKGDFDDINNAEVTQGLNDALAGKKAALNQDDMQKAIEAAQKNKMEEMHKKLETEAKENLVGSEKFLKENANKPDIKSTKSGLEYRNITNQLTKEDKDELLSYLKEQPKTGTENPTKDSTVTVSYVGTYTDKEGKVHTFDASKKRHEPAQFKVGQVIPGWQEGLQLMQPGETFEFFIPPALGYGKNGIPGVIPPNALLTFKVTLLKIENKADNDTQQPATTKKDEESSSAHHNTTK